MKIDGCMHPLPKWWVQRFNDGPEKHLFVRFDAFLKWRIQGIFILEFILHFAEYKKDGGARMQVSIIKN